MQDGIGDVAPVEGLLAVFGQPDQRLGEVRVADHLPLAEDPTVGSPQRRHLRGRRQQRREDLGHVGLLGVEGDAISSEPSGGQRELLERHRAPPAGRLAHPGGSPIDAAGGRPDVEDLVGVAEGHVEPLELCLRAVVGPARRLDEEVEKGGRTTAPCDEHVAARAQSGHQRLGDEGRQHRRHGRVDRVAPFPQHPRPRLRGERMAGGDHASLSCAHHSAISHPPTQATEVAARRSAPARLRRSRAAEALPRG